MTLRNSTTEPGQPWVSRRGSAPECGERMWRKWMPTPSIVVRNCGSAFRRRSVPRQSYSSAQ
jgi:hypothetical protein